MQGQMRAYIFKRLLLMIPTLLGVLTLTFAVVQFVPGGDIVYREGDQAHNMFVVVSGRLRVSRRDKAGA